MEFCEHFGSPVLYGGLEVIKTDIYFMEFCVHFVSPVLYGGLEGIKI
jgi:hypothetical protein